MRHAAGSGLGLPEFVLPDPDSAGDLRDERRRSVQCLHLDHQRTLLADRHRRRRGDNERKWRIRYRPHRAVVRRGIVRLSGLQRPVEPVDRRHGTLCDVGLRQQLAKTDRCFGHRQTVAAVVDSGRPGDALWRIGQRPGPAGQQADAESVGPAKGVLLQLRCGGERDADEQVCPAGLRMDTGRDVQGHP